MKTMETLFFCMVHDFLYVYIPDQKSGSENTRTTYKQGLKSFRKYVNDIAKIPSNRFEFKDCAYDFLLDYRNYLHKTMNQSERTVNNKLAVIKSYVRYAAARNISLQQYAFSVSQVPCYRTPKKQQPIIESEDALAALLQMPKNTAQGLRDKTIMSILYDSGMRVNELVSLSVGCVSFLQESVKIRIHGKGNKERMAVLSEKTSALVRQYMEEFHSDTTQRDPFIYSVIGGMRKHMSTRNIQKLIKKYADLARVEHDLPESVSPHTLRRTRGTTLYRDGVDLAAISILLGHSDIKTTRDHYSSPSIDQMREIANRRNRVIPNEVQLWPEDEDEISKILGLD